MKLQFPVWDDSEVAIRDWDYLLSRIPLFKPGRPVRSIYPSALARASETAVERRHNIIIADKQSALHAMPGNYFNIKSAPLSGCRSQGSVSAGNELYRTALLQAQHQPR